MIHMLVWHEGQVVRVDDDGLVAATPRGAYLGCACDTDFGETLYEACTPALFINLRPNEGDDPKDICPACWREMCERGLP